MSTCLPVWLCVSTCLPVCLPLCLSGCVYVHRSGYLVVRVHLSACLYINLCLCVSACLTVWLCVYTCLPIWLCVSTCLPVWLCMSTCLPGLNGMRAGAGHFLLPSCGWGRRGHSLVIASNIYCTLDMGKLYQTQIDSIKLLRQHTLRGCLCMHTPTYECICKIQYLCEGKHISNIYIYI